MQREGFGAELEQRASGDFGGDIGMAIAVAAHPGAEAQKDGQVEGLAGIVHGEGAAEGLINARGHFPDARRDREDAVHFFEHGGAAGPQEFGLPEDGELGAQVLFEVAALARDEVRAVKFLDGFAHAAEFGANGAAFGFAGMGGEDEFDREPVEGFLNLGGGEALSLKGGNAGPDGFAERLVLEFALAQNADAMTVFGEIREIEEDGEGADDGLDLGFVEGGDALGELVFGGSVAGAAAAGELANVFYQLKRGRAGQGGDRFAEHVGQHADIAPQELVTYFGQGFPYSFDERGRENRL